MNDKTSQDDDKKTCSSLKLQKYYHNDLASTFVNDYVHFEVLINITK